MPKLGLRKNTGYSAKSDDEMDATHEDSVQQLRSETTQAYSSIAEGVQQLRNETSQACSNIVSGVNEGFVSKGDLQNYHQEVIKQFQFYEQRNNEILRSLESLKKATLYFKNELQQREKFTTPMASTAPMASTNGQPAPAPTTSIPQAFVDDNASTVTRFDVDHDVIMRTAYPYTVTQVPDPGLFSGDISETDLFCQLCGDTFKTYPYRTWSEADKIIFVQSRLRGTARSWYQAKYPSGTIPATLGILLEELKKAFPDMINRKLKKIKLVNLKHSYGKINQYIDEFRKLTTDLAWPEEPLVLFFYQGLHPKYKEEINKMEKFPERLEEIITKCILFESSLEMNAKISQLSGNRADKKKSSNFRSQNNDRKSKNNNSNKNNGYSNKPKNNSNDNHVTDVQKISTKN